MRLGFTRGKVALPPVSGTGAVGKLRGLVRTAAR